MSTDTDAVLTVRMYNEPRIHLAGDLENVPHVSNFSVHFMSPTTCSVTNKKLLFLWNILAIFVLCSLFFMSREEVAMQLESRYVQVSLDQDLWDEFSEWYSGAPALANASQYNPDDADFTVEANEVNNEYDIGDILPSSGDIEWNPINVDTSEVLNNSSIPQAVEIINHIERGLRELELALSPGELSLAVIQKSLETSMSRRNSSVWKQVLLDGVRNTLLLDNYINISLDGLKLRFLPETSSPCWIEVVLPGDRKSRTSKRKVPRTRLSWQMRCLPAFFLGGFPKCGTTDLYNRLRRHPGIYGPKSKEPHWWSRKRVGGFPRAADGEAVPLHSYLHLFDRMASNMIRDDKLGIGLTVDGSASTIWDMALTSDERTRAPDVFHIDHTITTAYQISRLLPRPKMVVIVREPVSRVYSDFLYFQSGYIDSLSANDSYQDILRYQVRTQILEMQECLVRTNHDTTTCTFWLRHNTEARLVRLYIGLYHVHISNWLVYFPWDSIRVIQMEDYAKNKAAVLQDTVHFLGLGDYPHDVAALTNDNRRYRVRTRPREPLAGDIAAMLRAFYKPFNAKLADLLNDSKFMW